MNVSISVPFDPKCAPNWSYTQRIGAIVFLQGMHHIRHAVSVLHIIVLSLHKVFGIGLKFMSSQTKNFCLRILQVFQISKMGSGVSCSPIRCLLNLFWLNIWHSSIGSSKNHEVLDKLWYVQNVSIKFIVYCELSLHI
jgi:hypothetical protein